jgi:hypothetical protein
MIDIATADWIIWLAVFVGTLIILRDWRVFPVFFGFILIEGYGVQPLEMIMHGVGVLMIVVSVEYKNVTEEYKKLMKKEDKYAGRKS